MLRLRVKSLLKIYLKFIKSPSLKIHLFKFVLSKIFYKYQLAQLSNFLRNQVLAKEQ